jgi:hypothetical protein
MSTGIADWGLAQVFLLPSELLSNPALYEQGTFFSTWPSSLRPGGRFSLSLSVATGATDWRLGLGTWVF